MGYDLTMKRQDIKSGLYKTVGPWRLGPIFVRWVWGFFLYFRRAASNFLSHLFFPVTLYDEN